jgi:hypothetical protein
MRDAVVCVYDIARFTGNIVIDVMRTHSTFIVGGIPQENPSFIQSDEFLEELRERRARE